MSPKVRKSRLTAEQRKGRRLWNAADRACAALLAHVKGQDNAPMDVHYTPHRGVSVGISMAIEFEVARKQPQRSKKRVRK